MQAGEGGLGPMFMGHVTSVTTTDGQSQIRMPNQEIRPAATARQRGERKSNDERPKMTIEIRNGRGAMSNLSVNG